MGWTAYYQLFRNRAFSHEEAVALTNYVDKAAKKEWSAESFYLHITTDARKDRLVAYGGNKLGEMEEVEQLADVLNGILEIISDIEIRVCDDYEVFGAASHQIPLNSSGFFKPHVNFVYFSDYRAPIDIPPESEELGEANDFSEDETTDGQEIPTSKIGFYTDVLPLIGESSLEVFQRIRAFLERCTNCNGQESLTFSRYTKKGEDLKDVIRSAIEKDAQRYNDAPIGHLYKPDRSKATSEIEQLAQFFFSYSVKKTAKLTYDTILRMFVDNYSKVGSTGAYIRRGNGKPVIALNQLEQLIAACPDEDFYFTVENFKWCGEDGKVLPYPKIHHTKIAKRYRNSISISLKPSERSMTANYRFFFPFEEVNSAFECYWEFWNEAAPSLFDLSTVRKYSYDW